MNNAPTSIIKQALIYLHMLSFIPQEFVGDLPPLQDDYGEDWPQAVEAASELIVAFHQASRDPENGLVEALARAALSADSSPENCRAFQDQMGKLSQHPGRAKAENRLHRKRGCRLCETPCRYGYFSLVSEPDFDALLELLNTEINKPAAEQNPVAAVWHFTLTHLAETFQADKWHIAAGHLGNLAYCLVALATAKSRYPFPEEQMRRFQAMNQRLIEQYGVGSKE